MSEPFVEEVASLPGQLEWVPEPQGSLPPGEVLFAGMGGSALAAEAADLWLRPGARGRVVREAGLPPSEGKAPSVVCVSFSGNTRETLSSWREAGERGWSRAAVASGGRLLQAARDSGDPWVQVPAGYSPRSSLGYLIKGCLALCPGPGQPDWKGAVGHLNGVAEAWRERPLTGSPTSGGWVVAGTGRAAYAPARWAADFSENAKLPLWIWRFPEAAHNALMVLAPESKHPRPTVYTLHTRADAADEAWAAFQDCLGETEAPLVPVQHPHPDPWIEVLGLAHAGDWCSLQHARALGVPAGSLSLLDAFKARLDRRQSS